MRRTAGRDGSQAEIAVDGCPLSRRALLRIGLLGAGIATWRPATATPQGGEAEHRPRLDLPSIAENPAAVPIRVAVDHPMEPGHFIRSIEIVLDKDPVPHKGTYRFTPANGQAWIAFAMRSGTGGTVRATAECSRHGPFVATRDIRVTSDGCAVDAPDRDQFGNPRLRLPRAPKPGDVVEVRTKIDHASDTGLTFKGARYVRERPEFFVSRIHVTFDGEIVSEFQLTSAVGSNPLLRFPFKITRAGTLKVLFVNNEGRRWEAAEPIRPAG
jgi:sulfur-oxidizing protein SoxY